jgi:two-component system sensor histidine kinase UhpB
MHSPLHIFIVEDNPGDLFLLEEYISLSAIPVAGVRAAGTLEQAIPQLEQYAPDVIFLDLHLPDSSGLETFNRLRESAPGSAIIILSGLSDTEIALEAIALGAQDYLNKGEFDEKLLGRTIRYSVERWRNLEKLRQANERYRLVSKATHDMIWDWDLQKDEVFRDQEDLQEIFGFSSGAETGNSAGWQKLIHPEDAGYLEEMLREIKEAGRDFFEVEYRFLSESGDYRTIYDRGYVLRNAAGKAVRMIGASQDITQRKKLEAELEASRLQEQRAITEATIKGQEKERERLGSELHDNVNQILCTSGLYLDQALSSPERTQEMIRLGKEYVQHAIAEIRKLSHQLLPPSFLDCGLSLSLHRLADSISQTAGLKIYRHWERFDEGMLVPDEKLTIYRIIQEQRNNIIKHAEACVVIISLGRSDDGRFFRLSIKDDGKGFDTTGNFDGVGLRNIRSRSELFHAEINIASSPGNGCELELIFPAGRK